MLSRLEVSAWPTVVSEQDPPRELREEFIMKEPALDLGELNALL